MTTTLTTSKGPFDFTGLSAPARSVLKTTDEDGKEVFIVYDHSGNIIAEILAEGRELIGWHSRITEDQAREVVDNFITTAAFDPNRKVHIEKLRSLMQAERIYTSNPMGTEEPFVPYYMPYGMDEQDYYSEVKKHQAIRDEWEEIEQCTFPDWIILKVK